VIRWPFRRRHPRPVVLTDREAAVLAQVERNRRIAEEAKRAAEEGRRAIEGTRPLLGGMPPWGHR
jgi:hypothetical protein